MNKIFFYLVAIMIIYLVACNKEKEDINSIVIEATSVGNSRSDIATVKAKMRFAITHTDGIYHITDYEIASAEYENDGFTLTLS